MYEAFRLFHKHIFFQASKEVGTFHVVLINNSILLNLTCHQKMYCFKTRNLNLHFIAVYNIPSHEVYCHLKNF